MKIKPYNFKIDAYFKSEDGEVLVNIELDSKGKYYIRPSTTGGQHAGDYILNADNMDKCHQFIKDCLDSFKQMVEVNEAAFKEDKASEAQTKA